MNLADFAVYSLIAGSITVLALALIPARRVYREAGELSRSWLALVVLIVAFIVAYLIFGLVFASDLDAYAGLTVAGLLFGNACFILIACGLSGAGFHELRRLAALERHRANHDDLTGLPNRSAFMAHLHRAMHAANGQPSPAVLIADLDHFKTLNDTVGHHYGDILLQEAGMRLRRVLRKGDMVARLGGDEFGVLVHNVHGPAGLQAICRNLTAALERPFAVDGHIADMGMSVGAAMHPAHGTAAGELMKNAEIAMYHAKQGNVEYAVYEPGQDQYEVSRLNILGELNRAIDAGRLSVNYQPIFDLKSGALSAVEALVRWHHPRFGLLLPDEFVPLAEQSGAIGKLDRWMLSEVMDQLADWQHAGIGVPISINLSASNLQKADVVDFIADGIRSRSINPGQLKLEITESAVMSETEKAVEVIRRLDQLGVLFAIDDFGTGYSTLVYLKHLPVNEIKIDKSFVIDMTKDNNDALIIRSTIELAHNMGRGVIAEGVESQETLDLLRRWGCDRVQGYYIGRPLTAEDMSERLADPTERSYRLLEAG